MKAKIVPVLVLACVVATAAAAPFSGRLFRAAPDSQVTGEYVEARTASVFAGTCHYNGELVTTGRDALLAWNFTGGRYHGVELSGLRAVAAVTSEENLSDAKAPHRTDLTIDSQASDAQVAALTELLRAKCGNQLGNLVSVRRGSVAFDRTDSGYSVNAPGFAFMTVAYRTDNSCCVQPSSVWYSPLTPLDHRKVGFTESVAYTGAVADHWSRQGEDSAFYGNFTF